MIGALKRTDVHPTAVIVIPGPLVAGNAPHAPAHQPQTSVQVPADVDAQTSPGPVPYSSFAGVGRVTQSRWLHQVLAIQDKLSIRATESAGSALVPKVPSALVVGMPVSAGQRPVRDSVDIESSTQTTYAALATLHPDPVTSARYRKLMG